jgi:Plasmid replication region DNA-binding N-term
LGEQHRGLLRDDGSSRLEFAVNHTEMTQNVVNEAADALLVSGERPTPERVRAYIGTGTSDVISGLLDAWWESLGSRFLAREVECRTLRAVITELEEELARLKGRASR